MAKLTKRILVRLIICSVLIVSFTVFVRDWNGVRLLAVSPKILKYRPVIKKHAASHQLDWRLITALIVQESGFNEQAESPVGAKGLMQLMPETAKELGVTDPFEANESIAGATRYLRILYDLYPESSHPNRVRIALASYNGGRGHISDAQKIATHREHDTAMANQISGSHLAQISVYSLKKIKPCIQKFGRQVCHHTGILEVTKKPVTMFIG